MTVCKTERWKSLEDLKNIYKPPHFPRPSVSVINIEDLLVGIVLILFFVKHNQHTS